jgi:hypothetical protein
MQSIAEVSKNFKTDNESGGKDDAKEYETPPCRTLDFRQHPQWQPAYVPLACTVRRTTHRSVHADVLV